MACAIGGCFLGIYISTPQLRPVEADPADTSSTGELTVGADGSTLLLFGTLVFTFRVLNFSSFSLSFKVEGFDIYYYPIGASRQCLLYHGGTLLDSSNPALSRREKFGMPTNHPWVYFSEPDNEVMVRPAESQEGSVGVLSLPARLGLRIDPNAATAAAAGAAAAAAAAAQHQQLLQQLKALADDCAAYGVLLLGVEITDAKTLSFIAKVQNPGPLQIIQAIKCKVTSEAKTALAAVTRSYTSEILQGLKNQPELFQTP
ncbi:hypothetical protein, conserved [Eimeria tenella]|uniref:Uncharacterized protein n=1 Tax=Eimeria tenella TaxID=5802 RepID=U6LBG5_EIMTE|nr:hypothetical protein, conserved [Eimeria tenella]CDJ45100.1 hypothetical protein, conserved [Eimeria tenella]|eukprot:XP_013235847.1 hypothetical protein, conserved [Eimeria tenella]